MARIAGVDLPRNKQAMHQINAKGVTFLMVTHSLQLIPFATRAFEMQDGELKILHRAKQFLAALAINNKDLKGKTIYEPLSLH